MSTMAEKVLPYKNQNTNKKRQVAQMFDNIAPKYDLLNHTLSLGIDILWRKEAIRLLRPYAPKRILDVATGTADFAIEALSLEPNEVVGVDISEGMLEKGRQKLHKRQLDKRIRLESGDSENLNFSDNYFDAVIVSFGVRNFENLEQGLANIHRVLRPGGQIVVLEFSKPRAFPFKQLYQLYFTNILPQIGRSISKDDAAYTYLPESVSAFPDGVDFADKLLTTGFRTILCKPLTLGISTIYLGHKPA